jgi:uncharacterized coiled-coil DUF342 family protein
MEINETIIALVAAMFGGVGLKVIEKVLSRSAERADVAKDIRDELREELGHLKHEIVELAERLDKWRKQYYDLLSAFNDLTVVALTAGLEEEVQRIRERLHSLED